MRNSLLFRLLPVFFLLVSFPVFAEDIPIEESSDESTIDIFEDTTWTKDSELTFDKPVIVAGATLTIEEGVKVKFTKNISGDTFGMLSVQDGRIIAKGTEAKPIIFDRLHDDDWYNIDFQSHPDSEESLFRYVQFLHGGKKEEFAPGGDLSVTPGVSTLRYQEGKLRIENTVWKGSIFSDVKVPYPYSWGEGDPELNIVDSNFEYAEAIDEGNPLNAIEIASWPNVAVDASGDSCRSESGCHPAVRLQNNYYGDIRGPKGDVANPDSFLRFGKQVLGYVFYAGYRNTSLTVDPVIIIPGILGSMKNGEGVWVMDPILHSYDDLVASLKKNGYEEGKTLFVFPYDWYQKNEDTAALLQQEIKEIQEKTGSRQVDIVAHSMGGLVARAYAETGDQAQNIDQLITIGTPHRGAPEAYLKWEAGEGFSGIDGALLKHHFSQEAEESGYADIYDLIHHRAPSVQELLPIDNYLFDTVQHTERAYPDRYPRNEFLEQLALHESALDAIRRKVAVVGENGNVTISRIRVTDETDGEKWADGKPENFDDDKTDRGLERDLGDQTVTVESAQALRGAQEVVLNAKHADLPQAAECTLFRELSGRATCHIVEVTHIPDILVLNLFSPIDIQLISPSGKKVGKNFETGEVENEIPGAFYTGYHTDNEFITIPNPEQGDYRVLTQGTGKGGKYRVEISRIAEGKTANEPANESTATLTGTAVPNMVTETTATVSDTVVTLPDATPPDTTPPTTILSLGGTEGTNGWYTSAVTVTLSATDNDGGSGLEKTEYSLDGGGTWNVYTAPFTLTTEGETSLAYRSNDRENNSETAKTETIHIDTEAPEASITFNPATEQLEVQGRDRVDHTIPSATLTASVIPLQLTVTQQWLMKWFHMHFPTTQTLLTASLTDVAGHTTTLTFEQKRALKNRIDLALQSITGDGIQTNTQASIQYKWQKDTKKQYFRLASSLSVPEKRVESHYIPRLDQTWMMTKPVDLDDDTDDNANHRSTIQKLPGMVIPSLLTEKGKIKIVY